MLYIGEEVGRKGAAAREAATAIDIAVDPLEGTNLVAHGQANAMTVLAAAERGGLLHAPDTYLEKLCVELACPGFRRAEWLDSCKCRLDQLATNPALSKASAARRPSESGVCWA
jgi:fructose-1,6-bisphosphatase/sedoheptulose 1,7-bisphosphatase-like protein